MITPIRSFASQTYAVSQRAERGLVQSHAQRQENHPAKEQETTVRDGLAVWREMAIMQTALTQLDRIGRSGVLEPVQ